MEGTSEGTAILTAVHFGQLLLEIRLGWRIFYLLGLLKACFCRVVSIQLSLSKLGLQFKFLYHSVHRGGFLGGLRLLGRLGFLANFFVGELLTVKLHLGWVLVVVKC